MLLALLPLLPPPSSLSPPLCSSLKAFLILLVFSSLFFSLPLSAQTNAAETKESPQASLQEVQLEGNFDFQAARDSFKKTTNFLSTNQQGQYQLDLNLPKENLSILERYESTIDENFLRRTEVIFFISIPFAVLWSNFLNTLFQQFSVAAAYADGVRGNDLRASNFAYSHSIWPANALDPHYLFAWVNSITWPVVIGLNDFIERVSVKETYFLERKNLIENRFERDLLNQDF